MENHPPHLASRWKRLGGKVIDGLITIVIVYPFMIAAGVFNQPQGEPVISFGETIVLFIIGTLLFFVLHGYLLAKYGQSIGKMLIGTRIISVNDGQILSLGKLYFLRVLPIALLGYIPFVGGIFSLVNALFIFRDDKRCIHDLIAETIVVDV